MQVDTKSWRQKQWIGGGCSNSRHNDLGICGRCKSKGIGRSMQPQVVRDKNWKCATFVTLAYVEGTWGQ